MEAASSLEQALRRDDVSALSSALQDSGLGLSSLLLHAGQSRSLLMIAASCGAPAAVAALLATGACDVNQQSPSDGNSALHCACSGASASTARVIALLVRAGADKALRNFEGRTACELLEAGTAQAACGGPEGSDAPEGSDLLRPEYCTDDFRMYAFKIDCCPRLAESHDWTQCPFQHPGEKARRRDPRCYKYHGVPCPDFRKGTCKRGDACTYAHGVFECWLHPSRYRTQLCKEGAACRRSVCFFAHSVEQLREPATKEEGAEPGSPRGPLSAPADSGDTPRSWSPVPASSEDSVNASLRSSAELLPAVNQGPRLGVCVPPHPLACSADSSLSSTPHLEHSLGAASLASQDSLRRTLSSLSLSSDDPMSQVVALQHVAAGGVPPTQAALLAAAGCAWGAPHQPDHLSVLAGGAGPLAAGLQGMMLPDHAAVQAAVQAAAMQHQLASLLQTDGSGLLTAAAADPATSLLAGAGAGVAARQPLLPLSLNLGHQSYHHAAPASVTSCLAGLGL